VLDAELRIGRHEDDRGVGDVDRSVIHGELAGELGRRIEERRPRGRGGRDLVGAPHQDIGATAVRYAVMDAVHRVVVLVLEVGEDLRVARDQVDIDRLDESTGDQPERRIARCRDDVVFLGVGLEQRERLVGRAEGLDRDLATGLLLERGDPINVRTGRAVLHVAWPGQHFDLGFCGS
jgi:hypothetical protein